MKNIKPHVHFISFNSISSIPVLRLILKGLDKSLFSNIVLSECYVDGMSARFEMAYKHIDILRFEGNKKFNSQTVKEKIAKYIYTIKHLWQGVKQDALLYTIDIETLALAILIKKLKRVSCRIIYHQIETIEKEKANFPQRFAFRFIKRNKDIDLAIFPEQNRLQLFKNIIDHAELKTFLLPNTCYPKVFKTRESPSKKIRIGHIGILSFVSFYLEEFLTAAKNADQNKFEFIFVGIRDEQVKAWILQSLPQAIVIGWIDHTALEEIYQTLSAGLILYKPRDFNTTYCAPNKLYEYWSYGVSVLAPDLPGLIPVFDAVQKGKLVDFQNSSAITSAINEMSQAHITKKEELQRLFNDTLSVDVFIQKLEQEIKQLFEWEKSA